MSGTVIADRMRHHNFLLAITTASLITFTLLLIIIMTAMWGGGDVSVISAGGRMRNATETISWRLSSIEDSEADTDNQSKESNEPFLFITGASDNHFQASLSTMVQVRKHQPAVQIIYWDFGLSNEQVEIIKSIAHLEYHRFPFEDYPEWMNIAHENRGEYAWKPLAIYETFLLHSNTKLLWLDGDVAVEQMDEITDRLNSQGFFTLQSHGSVQDWVHRDTIRYLGGSTRDLWDKPMASGGACGFDASRPEIELLLRQWRDCAIKYSCIAPPGSNRINHRQDQAALTVLMHQHNLQVSSRKRAGIFVHKISKESVEDLVASL